MVLLGYFILINSSQCYNVLLIVIDDLRPALGVYGDVNAYTPNIDTLAQSSFIFKNAFCQQARCAASRNSFLTSRRPDSLHLYDSHNYWRNVGNFTTLPQHFLNNDYFTHSIGKIFEDGISSNFSDDIEYSWSDEPFHPTSEIFESAKVCLTNNGSLARNLICPVIVKQQPTGALPDLESLNAALDFLRNADEITYGLPYFLAIGFLKPHIPFRFPSKYLTSHCLSEIILPNFRWKPPTLPNIAWSSWADLRMFDDISKFNISYPFGQVSDYIMKRIIQAYYAAVTYIDDLIGILLSEVSEDTIIVLFGDHGFSLGEHGEFSKYSNYDVATRVPLIIRVPNMLNEMVVISELVELVDIFPTLVDLTRVSPSLETCKPNRVNAKLCTEGSSLLPLMMSKVESIKCHGKSATFSQYPRSLNPSQYPNSDTPFLKDIKIMGYSIRTKTHRYTEWVEFNTRTFRSNWDHVYDRELYDYAVDPNENFNLADRDEVKDIMATLRRKLILGWRYA
ncbi:hypothetical protein Trydic_g20840 [Trypoxylus dichotomus]